MINSEQLHKTSQLARLLDERQEPPDAVGLEPVRRVPRRPGRLDDVELERVALLRRRVREAQVVERARQEDQVAGVRRQRREAVRPRVGRRGTATICQELCQGSDGCPSRRRRCALPPKASLHGREAAEIQNGLRYLSRCGPWLRTVRSIGDMEFFDLRSS